MISEMSVLVPPPKNGTHGEFEPVPSTRHSEARTSGDEGCQHRVLAEMRANCQRIGGKIEDAANTGDNRRQTLEIGKANGRLETISGCRFDDQTPRSSPIAIVRAYWLLDTASIPGVARARRNDNIISQS
jgi:hypothetical protein